ncbi:MAG: ribonuclease HI family protein [Dehalococcoidia bacterium]|nr:ribonuclease HI family protein [Dehalococcoidia bacterium]MDW8008687.1 ribonuclease HI family protein [Chloroflexota bacterium]
MKAERVVAYADGASRGNPGPAAIGAVLLDEAGREIYTISRPIGVATNNQAEYKAAIAAVEAALALGARSLELRMDSELVVRQLQHRYRVRDPVLRRLFARLLELRRRFQEFQVKAIPREQNRRADALANRALDQAPEG